MTGVVEEGSTCEVEAEVVDCELSPVELVDDTFALEEVAGLPPDTLTLAVALKLLAVVYTSLRFSTRASRPRYSRY